MRPALFAAVLALAGCRRSPSATSAEAAGGRCGALVTTTARRPVTGGTLEQQGPLVRDPRVRRAPVVLAVLGGPNGAAAPEGHLARLAVALRGADLVAVLGGLHGDAATLEAWLAAVVPAGVPTLLLPADTEALPAFRERLAPLQRAHPAWMDGTAVRAYLAPDVEVVTLPGVPSPALTRAGGEGCVLASADLDALVAALPRPAAPRLLLSATAPAQRGPAAIDRGLMGTHVGSALVARAFETIGAHGVVALLPRESAGTLGDLAGTRVLPLGQDLAGTRFALSVGSASSDPIETVEGAWLGPSVWRIHVGRGERVRVERLGP